jgi:UDP-N-acetylglucosamine acyltransferase
VASAVSVHPTAIVSPSARLEDGVFIGPLCVVGDDVTVGAGSFLIASCTVLGPTRLGEKNTIHPYAVLGAEPQDRSYAGEPTRLEIGCCNVFREHVTAHRGTVKGHGVTRIGSHGLFMAGAHIGHDARVGDYVTLANNTLIAGHVRLGDHTTCGGAVAIAPHVRIGDGAFLAGGAMVERDVPPWVIAAGDRARVRAPNHLALMRCGVPEASRQALDRAFRAIFRSRMPRRLALAEVKQQLGHDPYVADVVAFLEASRDPAERRRAGSD